MKTKMNKETFHKIYGIEPNDRMFNEVEKNRVKSFDEKDRNFGDLFNKGVRFNKKRFVKP